MQKTLIFVGILLLVSGLAWPFIDKIGLGRLPGDIFINKPNLKVYIPITTMVLVSVVISLIMWLFRK